ncbi:hypothetical protein [Nocardia macrotermitis]|uniref:Uncharacterized protein n=1 Tax=Nocardia macrotermitis TaxID=2585198 RepID=A0A7K0D837_9NOCA|nr:hypothetical protein [Nocardia macrotermitis]MQY21739.1 hypothetical protein [Nocardia macrotermitis]
MAPNDGTILAIDPNVYYEAGKKLITLTADINTAIARDLVPGLRGSAGMGGNYPAVASWNSTVHQQSADVRTVILAYAAALAHFGDILSIAGYNWDAAEYKANRSKDKGSAPALPTLGSVSPVAAKDFPEIPDPQGDNGAGVVIEPAGGSPSSWTGAPNGRLGTLNAVATAWNALASSRELSDSPAIIRAARATFDSVRAPEVPAVTEALDALCSGAEQICSVAKTLAISLREHHDDLAEVRNGIATAAATAFPAHPGVDITARTDDTSVHVSVAANLSQVDIFNADDILNTTFHNSRLATVLSGTVASTDDFTGSGALGSYPKLKALSELPLLVESGDRNANTTLNGEMDTIATWYTPASTLTAADLAALDQYGPQMKKWAVLSVQYGNEAGVDPRMVLSMVLQEGAPLRTGLETNLYKDLENPSTYHPNPNGAEAGVLWDKARLEASKLGLSKQGAGNSIGLTNQKERPFNEVKAKYPDQFKGKQWSDLVGNDDLAIKAAAYNLKMLNEDGASQAAPNVRAGQPLDQFLGSSYNAYGITERSQSVATQQDSFTASEIEHGKSTLNVYKLADKILCGSGAYR